MNNMYNQNKKQAVPTIYNTKKTKSVNEIENQEKSTEQSEIKILREAHVTEITIGNQTLRVMDAGHIQGVIKMQERMFNDIKQVQSSTNSHTKSIQKLAEHVNSLSREVAELKSKINGNFL